ncbi:MAG: RNA-binding protein [Kiloniellales bacterium]
MPRRPRAMPPLVPAAAKPPPEVGGDVGIMGMAAGIPVNDGATAKPAGGKEREPLRRCIVTGAIARKAELLRFVVGPDDRLVPDMAGRLPGRGLWLSPSRNIVKRACAKAAFAKVARRAVRVPDDLDDRVERQLAGRLMDGLGLVRRAGQAVAGFEKVRAALRRGPVRVLFTAADASETALAKGRSLTAGQASGAIDLVGCLSGAELGAAFGRDQVTHAAVRPGALAERLVGDAARLKGFRDTVAVPAADGD